MKRVLPKACNKINNTMFKHQDQLLEAKGHTKLCEAVLCIGITSKLAVGIVNCSAKYDILICTETYLDGLITLHL